MMSKQCKRDVNITYWAFIGLLKQYLYIQALGHKVKTTDGQVSSFIRHNFILLRVTYLTPFKNHNY